LTSDEIYALSVWENRVDEDVSFNQSESMLSRDTANLIDPGLVHVLWGMSKDFGANGLRVGAIIFQSSPVFHIAQRCLSLYSFVSSMSDQITASILQDDAFTDKYIQTYQEMLAQSHEFLVHILNVHGIDYSHGCNAGFFLWVNLGKKYLQSHPRATEQGIELTEVIFEKLLEHKVYVAHGIAYGSEIPGWFRVVFSHPRPWLEEAMQRILDAII
jgi:aspartate/methionine/tyrosine aminotransferase